MCTFFCFFFFAEFRSAILKIQEYYWKLILYGEKRIFWIGPHMAGPPVKGLTGQRAAQTWCLLRYLPHIIADIINESSPTYDVLKNKWRVITLLLHIMLIIFSPIISQGMIVELKYLIAEHHTLFIEEFDRHLLPKHHLMIHYPTVISRVGPLIHLWTMRFEGKHNYFKHLVRQYRNFKAVFKTLAAQHQRYIYYQKKKK